MNDENNRAAESGIIIKAAAAECDEATARIEIDPRELAIIVRGRIAALNYLTLERESQAARTVRSHSKRIDELIHEGAPLMKIYAALGIMEEACQGLTAPIPIPSVDDQIRGAFSHFLNLSWDTNEVEGLRRFAKFAKHGERISDITISSLKIGDREIARAQVREDMKNRGWSHASLFQYERNEQTALANELAREEIRKQGGVKRLIFSDSTMNQKTIQQ